jgi:ELWxxDGT repeat protein
MVFNNTLFFSAYTIANGYELWKTDGTGGGTVLVMDIFPGSNSGFVDYNGNFYIGLDNVWEQNGSFFFVANDNNSIQSNNNVELWKSDGTTGGTVKVHEIYAGNDGSHPNNFVTFNNQLFFGAYTNTYGTELWKTDGTSGGTLLVKDIRPGNGYGVNSSLYKIIAYGNSFYFHAFETGPSDHEIWKTDGTAGGTVKLLDIYAGTNGSYSNSFVILPNDNVIFLATDANNGNELWVLNFPGISSVGEFSLSDFSVFPNPVTNGSVTLVMSDGMTGAYTLELVDINGKMEFTQMVQATPSARIQVQLPEAKPGIYFIRLTGSKGFQQTRKILVPY